MARLLLDHQARVDDPGGVACDGITPLMDAACNGFEEVVRLLVEYGADLALKDSQVGVALGVVGMKRYCSRVAGEYVGVAWV